MKKYDKAIVITNPMIAANKSAEVTLCKFIRVISAVYSTIQVIGGNISLASDLNSVGVCNFPIVRASNKIRRIINLLLLQVKMAKAMMQYGNKDQPVFFWIGDKMILPFFAAKIKGCEINYFLYGNTAKEGNVSVFAKISSNLIRWMARNADYVCAESEAVFGEWPKLKVKKTRVVHLYTEDIRMTSWDEKENIIGMLCRLTPGKHIIESIHAFSEFHSENPQWIMEIIGSGVQETACRELIRNLQAEDYIIMRGWVNHEYIYEYTDSWKYLLFPTDTEGMPNSVIEMMGRGILAIASPVGGIKKLINDRENGWLIYDTSVQGIKEAIQRALSANNAAEMSNAAWNTVDKCYSLQSARELAERELKFEDE